MNTLNSHEDLEGGVVYTDVMRQVDVDALRRPEIIAAGVAAVGEALKLAQTRRRVAADHVMRTGLVPQTGFRLNLVSPAAA